MSRRTERIANLIRGVVAEAIQSQISDPRLQPLTSVTRVEVSDDLSIARVNISVFSDSEPRRKLSIAALEAATGRMRQMLGRQLATRVLPRLVFHLDDSFRRGRETLRVLEDALRRNPPAAEPSAAMPAADEPSGDDAPRPSSDVPEDR